MAPGNPLGLVIIEDSEVPRTFTALAREVVSGGDFVFVSGAAGVVSSGADSYLSSDALVALAVAGANEAVLRVNGLMLQNTGSNAYGTCLTRGAAIVKCGGSVFGGQLVQLTSGTIVNSVESITSGAIPNGLYTGMAYGKGVGRAQTDGASGGFAVVYFNF